MALLTVEVVAVDRMVWAGEATRLVAKTLEGEIGILPGHEPVLALLADSAVRIEGADGERLTFAVHKGFFSVADNRVSVLAESAELSTQIDVARAEAALASAKSALAAAESAVAAGGGGSGSGIAGSAGGASGSTQSDDPESALARAETRLKVANPDA